MCHRIWLRTQIVNAYMSLLSTRSKTRWQKYVALNVGGGGVDRVMGVDWISRTRGRARQWHRNVVHFSAAFFMHNCATRRGATCLTMLSAGPAKRSVILIFSLYTHDYTHIRISHNMSHSVQELHEMDIIVFPINVSNTHWCLAVVYPKVLTIRYFSCACVHTSL